MSIFYTIFFQYLAYLLVGILPLYISALIVLGMCAMAYLLIWSTYE